jgi:RNA polymerase sigma-70 factor (ECF subfamily)
MTARRASDNEVSDFLRGDRAVHETLRRWIGRVVRSFRFPGAAVEDDLIQETLCRVFINLSAGAFRGDASLATYARRVTRYVCLEHIRRRRFDSEVDPTAVPASPASSSPEAVLMRAEDHRLNLGILASLAPETRHLLTLIFVEGLTYSEVGERLGISEAAVKLRVHRCRLTMRSAQAEERPEEAAEPSAGWRHYEKVKE